MKARQYSEREITMAKLDVLKTIEKTRGHVADRYDVYPEDLMKIMEKYVHPYSMHQQRLL